MPNSIVSNPFVVGSHPTSSVLKAPTVLEDIRARHQQAGQGLPALPPVLQRYFSMPRAAEGATVFGLAGLPYTSTPVGSAPVDPFSSPHEFIAALLPTPTEAGALATHGLATIFLPQWQSLVAEAAARNGGLGTSEDGFLAWSEQGFARLRNPQLSPEQNRRLAAMSLQLGLPIEKLPSNRADALDAGGAERLDFFLTEHESELARFASNPSEDLHVKYGRRRYSLKYDEASGLARSRTYKKKSGWRKFTDSVLGTAVTALSLVDPIAWVGQVARNVPALQRVLAPLSSAGLLSGGLLTETRAVLTRLQQRGVSLRSLVLTGLEEASKAASFLPGPAIVGQAIRAGLAYLTTTARQRQQ